MKTADTARTRTENSLAVLISGGLDSAILLGTALKQHEAVWPIFIRCGLFWESVELAYLRRFLKALPSPSLKPLTVLDQPATDLYDSHWSITGEGVPGARTADEAVFLPGRNILLLAKSLLWCHLHDVPALALGSLQTNPFPDASAAFFRSLTQVVNRAVEGNVEVRLPFAGMKKKAVMLLGKDLPLRNTFSCIKPEKGLHCGRCNKCAERRLAFQEAGLPDPTMYLR